jgi:hypothetical protein
MDIPVFGWFFRKTNDTLTERTELIIMITPRVIRNNAESLTVTDDFRRKLGTVAGEIERMRRAPARDELPPPKVVPDKESRATPQDAPNAGPRLGQNQSPAPDDFADPMAAEAEPPQKPGPMKTAIKFLTFGLVR